MKNFSDQSIQSDSDLAKSFSESVSTASTTIDSSEMQQVFKDLENPPAGTIGLNELLREIERGYST